MKYDTILSKVSEYTNGYIYSATEILVVESKVKHFKRLPLEVNNLRMENRKN